MITNILLRGILLRKIKKRKRYKIMRKKFEITPMTRIFAENDDGTRFILTNNQVATFDDLQIRDTGCLVDTKEKIMSPELPIMVLTKQEFFGKVKTNIDLEKVKSFKQVG